MWHWKGKTNVSLEMKTSYDIGEEKQMWHWKGKKNVTLERKKNVTLERKNKCDIGKVKSNEKGKSNVTLERKNKCDIGKEGQGKWECWKESEKWPTPWNAETQS